MVDPNLLSQKLLPEAVSGAEMDEETLGEKSELRKSVAAPLSTDADTSQEDGTVAADAVPQEEMRA